MSTGNISPSSCSHDDENCAERSASSLEDIPTKDSNGLPKQIPIDLGKLFQRQPNKDIPKSQEDTQEDSSSVKTVESLKNTIDGTLQEKLFQWQDVSSWEFKFPETVFTGDEAPVEFHRQKQELNTGYAASKLSDEQILSIREHGEFTVKDNSSSQNNIGTTWRINPLLVKGNEQIKKTFLNTLSFSWGQLLEIPKRLTWKNKKDENNRPNILTGLRSVVSLVGEIANLTVGTVKMQQYSDEEVQQEIKKEYSEQTVLSYFEDMTSAFFKFVKDIDEQQQEQYRKQQQFKDIYEWKSAQEGIETYSKIRQNLDDFNAEFARKAQELEDQKIVSLERGYLTEDEALYAILEEKQKLLFDMMEERNQPENTTVRNHLKDLIKAAQITVRHYEQLAKDIANRKSAIEAQLIRDHPVKSLVYSWITKRIKSQMKPIILELVATCNSQITTELSTHGLKSQEILFQRFAQFSMNSHKLFKQNYKRIQLKNRTPARVFETAERILGEHKVVECVNSYDGQIYFQEESMKIYKTPTSFCGWRIALNLVRWKAWTVNALDMLFYNALNGPLGIKALIKSKEFPRRYTIDQRTGMKTPSGSYIKPYVEVLRDIYQGVLNSRIAFEALPDRGIFGKRFARIFNYLECYVFRGLVVGGIVACGMPIAILANCIISAFLAITSWLWMPIPLFLRWIYGIFIYDLDSPSRDNWGSQSSHWLGQYTFGRYPLMSAIGAAIFGGIETAASIWSATVVHPGSTVLGLISAYGLRAFSEMSDYLMCGIIQRIGRQPDADSKIAWKVKGQGVTQQYTESMNIEDVKVLVRSWLERTELDMHVSKLREAIQQPIKLYSQYAQQLFSSYGYPNNSSSYLTQNVNHLNQLLSVQYQSRLNKLPVLSSFNVKFTDQELAELFPQCQNIVQSFVVSHKIQEYVFKNQGLNDSDFTKLTENILIEIFHDSDILFGTNELDKRIEIKTNKKPIYTAIVKAIAGETELNVLTKTIAPRYRKFQRNEICRFVDIAEVENNARLANQNQSRIFQRQFFEDPSRECFYLPFGEFEKVAKEQEEEKKNNNKMLSIENQSN